MSTKKAKLAKKSIRVSFDVPIDDHTFLKTECTKARIPLRNLMQEVFHKTVEDFRKKELKERLMRGFQESYKAKGSEITQEKLDRWEKMIDDV